MAARGRMARVARCVAISRVSNDEEGDEHAHEHDDTVHVPATDPHDRLLDRVADYARRIEASGFPGIWVGDSLGRGRPTLDPLVELATLAAVTRQGRTGHRRAAVAAASSDRTGASRAVGAGTVGEPPCPRRRQRLDEGRLRSARLRLRHAVPHAAIVARTSCVARGAASPPTPAARYRPGRAAKADRPS